ncbi:hypothetical protein P5673_022974 [Acropora cervicornis]|uniref:Uncharacterized protein n=1 Tax=Acropora cervicornis TaxID=6130 RepID=A0AAD9Q603_ACRCE|nr:hypothetical protein P5673_022974 [Acropora cervicornis]
MAKSELARNIPISVLEGQNGCLVHLDSSLISIGINRMIHVGFFACADTAINLTDYSFVQNFKQNHSGSGIKDLLYSRPVCFVLCTQSVIFNLFIRLHQNVSSSIGKLRAFVPFNTDSVSISLNLESALKLTSGFLREQKQSAGEEERNPSHRTTTFSFNIVNLKESTPVEN